MLIAVAATEAQDDRNAARAVAESRSGTLRAASESRVFVPACRVMAKEGGARA